MGSAGKLVSVGYSFIQQTFLLGKQRSINVSCMQLANHETETTQDGATQSMKKAASHTETISMFHRSLHNANRAGKGN